MKVLTADDMSIQPFPTFFAPAEKADTKVVHAQNDKIAGRDLIGLLLDSFPEGAVVLNSQRQIVYANDKVASFLSVSRDDLVGLRLGEALGCVHADEPPGGCGTTESCRFCGAAQAMETSRLNLSREVQECRILRSGHVACPALDLRLWTVPLELEGEWFTILAVRDISDEKRRQLLERIFFHDLVNLAGGLRGVLDMLPDLSGAEAARFARLAAFQAEQLVEEVECQRDLTAAERGELTAHFKLVSIGEFIDRLCSLYAHHPVSKGKHLVVEPCAGPDTIHTDPLLLGRVLGNLIKNALEASQSGDTVTVRCTLTSHAYNFAVNNPSVLDEAVRAQVFQRSFSTKPGKGRGLGTYSVKLLTERYLQGRVAFTSSRGQGTTFQVELPAVPAETSGPNSPFAIDGTDGTQASANLCTLEQAQESHDLPVAPDSADGGRAPLAPLQILLAEDNPVNQLVALSMLRKWGQGAAIASNGKEVLAALDREPFDVVLMDVQMPEMDGYETTNHIRAREKQAGGHVTVVAMTAHAMKGDRERCLAAGMDDYISKPIKPDDLYAVLERSQRTFRVPQDDPQKQIGPGALPELSVLDPNAVDRLRGLSNEGDPLFLDVVFKAFLQDSRLRMGDLREAFRVADPDAIRSAAHAMRGAGIQIGAARVAEVCQRLEDLATSRTMDGVANLVIRLEHDLKDVESAIERQLSREAS